jgi:tripartite-type tricarboxylate transporter receptor subunit TctC
MRRLARRPLLLGALAASGATPPRDAAHAQAGAGAPAFPTKPITWVVPWAAGGITDASSRIVAQRMGQILGQTIVVENRPGAGGTIGTDSVLRAPADGHTLLYGSQGPIAAAPNLFPHLRYDPLRDFEPVHGLGASPNMIVCNPQRPWRRLAEVVEAARGAPETITYGSPGIGTSGHLGAEMLQQATGVRLTHAPYANGTQALNDVIGGRLDLMWDFPLTSIPHVREGRLRALAVTDEHRVALAPEVPTTAESGVPGVVMVAWAGLFVARGTPPEAIARLAAATREALADPKVVEFFNGTATVLWPEMGTDRFRAFLAEEVPRIAALIRRAGARAG